MVRYTTLRTVPVLVLCMVLASPLAIAAAPRPGGEPFNVRLATQDVGDLFGWLRGALASLWSKNGCEVDPNGRYVKSGCRVDPFGRCLDAMASPASTNKNGCQVDPYGQCRI